MYCKVVPIWMSRDDYDINIGYKHRMHNQVQLAVTWDLLAKLKWDLNKRMHACMHAWFVLIWHLGDRMHPVVLTIISIHRYMQSNVLIFGLESVRVMCSFDWWKKRLFWCARLWCDAVWCDAMWYDVIWGGEQSQLHLKLLSEHRMCMRTDARELSEPIDRSRCIVKLF